MGKMINGVMRKSRWLKAWLKAINSGRLADGEFGEVFGRCSWSTRLIASEIWRGWHETKMEEKCCYDPDEIELKGRTLTFAAASELMIGMTATAHDLDVVRHAMRELIAAGLVLQVRPECWLVRFGAVYTTEDRDWHRRSREEIAQRFPDGISVGVPVDLQTSPNN